MRRHVRLEYTLRPEIDLATYEAEARAFVAGIHGQAASSIYTVYRHEENARRFTHVGDFDVDVVPDMQKQPFFTKFSAFLRDAAIGGPDPQRLAIVATTVS